MFIKPPASLSQKEKKFFAIANGKLFIERLPGKKYRILISDIPYAALDGNISFDKKGDATQSGKALQNHFRQKCLEIVASRY